ncbi:helix-turn-helix domain-containing protein [Baekduia sp. Peel2402]|uniref:helix-turn-helix domain-containing protein n=1 Tax=Baekduia sp. Peel2402 TaxID=3458296 RepID=UPI00403E8CB3
MADAWAYLIRRTIRVLAVLDTPRADDARGLASRATPTDTPAALREAADALRAVLPEIDGQPSRTTVIATADMLSEVSAKLTLHERLDRLELAFARLERRFDEEAGGTRPPARSSRRIEPVSPPPPAPRVPHDPLPAFAVNLLTERTRRGLTQEALALEADMDQSYYGRLERGEIDPGVRTVARLAVALSVEPADLMADIGPEPG